MAMKGIQVLEHPHYFLDMAPADFFLFRRAKEALASTPLEQDSLKTSWEGAIRTITAEEFGAAFQRWFERAEKCIRIGSDFMEKS